MSLCPTLLPILAFVILLGVFTKELRIHFILEACVKSYLCVFTLVVASTEFLSAYEIINSQSLIVFWLVVCIAGVLSFFLSGRRLSDWQVPRPPQPLQLSTTLLLASLCFVLAGTFVTALLYPPNNWDSMTYHMSRVAYWIGNQSVSFYPTHNLRQLFQPPAAEYGLLQLQLLSGSDLLVNLLQWLSFCLCICIASLIAAEFSLSRNAQLVTAIAVATIPMAILQSSSTQNDLVLSGFTLTFAYFMLRLGKHFNWSNLIFTGVSLGLALLAKGTSLVYAAAIGVTLSLPIIWTQRRDRAALVKTILGLSLIVILALSLNVPFFYRNYQYCGLPQCADTSLYINEEISPAGIISNGLRNAGLHLGVPIPQVNDFSTRAIGYVLGKHAFNPKTTFGAHIFTIVFSRHEEYASNPMHLALAFLTILISLVWIRQQKITLLWYLAAVLLAACLYVLVFKWQPWASRLHTPLFILAAPLSAAAIATLWTGKDRPLLLLAAILIIYSLPYILANHSRSIITLDWLHKERTELYFQNLPGLHECYIDIMDYLKEADATDIGLYLGVDDWDYPLWVLAGEDNNRESKITFRHVGVTGLPADLHSERSNPKYVISTRTDDEWDQRGQYKTVLKAGCAQVWRARTVRDFSG